MRTKLCTSQRKLRQKEECEGFKTHTSNYWQKNEGTRFRGHLSRNFEVYDKPLGDRWCYVIEAMWMKNYHCI